MPRSTYGIHPARIQILNARPIGQGDHVLYWMQQSQREHFNHALEYAITRANELRLPLLVGFGLTTGFPDANLRHYRFMLEGLQEVSQALARRQIGFVLQIDDPARVALRLARQAALVVCDRGYLRVQKEWRQKVAEQARCSVVQVESDVVVPVNLASEKREFGARTLRPKVLRFAEDFVVPLPRGRVKRSSLQLQTRRIDLANLDQVIGKLQLDQRVRPVSHLFRGGTSVARRRFQKFLSEHLADYREHRNQPQTSDVSHMSKYLHFGQISPVWLMLEVQKHRKSSRTNVYSFVDELLVRRELAMNWVEHTSNYDQYGSLPDWARKTLKEHAHDQRPYTYSIASLEKAETHDRYWNASMREMMTTGYMHNYMRMYWGKKILEWSRSPEAAFKAALQLNNKYFVDGRDPNSFANVAWVFGQHDRPWPERPIFGKIRYMNAAGLKRKCDIEGYVEKVKRLTERTPYE